MHRTVSASKWKGEESTRKDSQGEMPFLGAVRAPESAPRDFVAASSHIGAMRYASQRSGMDDYEIADALSISHGYMSKLLKGTAGLWGAKLVRFMRVTGSLAPLQWLADQMGCDVTLRDSRAAEVAALQSRLRELGHAA